jgi:ectoine hydroxylase-related dioxygenase (phytanoyl-CoA dioxygenase family)
MWAAPGDGLGLKSLWTDAPDAVFRLARLHRDRAIDDTERDDLLHFIEHGWLIWRRAIEPALIDALLRDIRALHKHPGMFVRTDHRNGQSRLALNDSRPDKYESLFDLYVNLDTSRQVCLHPRIARFLSLVFGTRPVAMQQLLFQRSNAHDVHQDTSVVAVEDPLLLAASWIALQDVREGSGELAFYDRSHKLPHYLFKDGSKRMTQEPGAREAYVTELRDACEKAGLAYERFLARKGDVFFWSADLVHLSHPRTLPEDTNRMSCVTHYHPATTTPYWFRFHPDHRTIRPFRDLGGYASYHYTLSDDGAGMIAPHSPDLG